MANTRKSRVPKEKQLKLINECRTSGMTDTDWCCEHGIAVSTFYYWAKQLRKEAAQIPTVSQNSNTFLSFVFVVQRCPTDISKNPCGFSSD